MQPRDPHILMSVTKSVTGLLVGRLVARGELDPAAGITRYLPELAESAFAGATLRNLLDMRVGLRFEEAHGAGDGPFIDYRVAMGWNPPRDGAPAGDLRSFLAALHDRRGDHGGPMRYRSPISDVLGWALERVSGQRFADLLARELWAPMGAASDAAVTVDRLGAPRAAGGLCCTLRDLARLGLLLLEEGSRDGRAIVPAEWLADIRRGGDRAAWEAGDYAGSMSDRAPSYRSQWYVVGDDTRRDFFAVGIHGQYLYVSPATEMVVTRLSAQPRPEDDFLDRLTLDGCWALAEALRERA